jgi:hypothetical protein
MTLRTQRLSLSKDRIKVLLLEGINDSAADLMVQAGYTNMIRLPKALDHDALLKAVEGVHVLGIRSRTQLTERSSPRRAGSSRSAASPSAPTRSISRRRACAAYRCSMRPSRTPAASPN